MWDYFLSKSAIFFKDIFCSFVLLSLFNSTRYNKFIKYVRFFCLMAIDDPQVLIESWLFLLLFFAYPLLVTWKKKSFFSESWNSIFMVIFYSNATFIPFIPAMAKIFIRVAREFKSKQEEISLTTKAIKVVNWHKSFICTIAFAFGLQNYLKLSWFENINYFCF